MPTLSNRVMRRLAKAGFDVNEVLEEVDRLVWEMNRIAAELKLIVSLVGRV